MTLSLENLFVLYTDIHRCLCKYFAFGPKLKYVVSSVLHRTVPYPHQINSQHHLICTDIKPRFSIYTYIEIIHKFYGFFFTSGGIPHSQKLWLLRVTQGYPEQSFMWNPPLIILSVFHWLSENSKPRVFFMHYLSTLKCKHWSLFKVYVVLFKNIWSFKYPVYTVPWNSKYQGFCWKCAKTQQLLRVTLGYPEYSY